jgi:hypothetical protein
LPADFERVCSIVGHQICNSHWRIYPEWIHRHIRTRMLRMARSILAVLLSVPITFVSCSQPTGTQSVANTGSYPLKSQIPPPDPTKYRPIVDARDWQNPYLVVRANGIDVRPISAATEASTMPPADVVAYLEKLPSIAWPYGLVVAVQENGVRAPGGDAQIKRNREELVRLLENAGVTVNLWPSA